LDKKGVRVTIAGPVNDNVQYITDGYFIQLGKFFGRLFGVKKLSGFKYAVVFDDASLKIAKRANLKKIQFREKVGVDLSIWSPKAISGNRQTMILSEYNILPHQKLILVVEPTEKDIAGLVQATTVMNKDDYIIAIYGNFKSRAAKRANRKIKGHPHIMYIGRTNDLPSLMRASFAVISFSEKDDFYKRAAIAMGRTTAWRGQGPKPNIVINSGDYEGALKKILGLGRDTRERFEEDNLLRAGDFGCDEQIEKIMNLLPGK
jgi:hypothetical protein